MNSNKKQPISNTDTDSNDFRRRRCSINRTERLDASVIAPNTNVASAQHGDRDEQSPAYRGAASTAGSNIVQSSRLSSKMEGDRLTRYQRRIAKATQSVSRHARLLNYGQFSRKFLDRPPSGQDKSETKLKRRNDDAETSLSNAISDEMPSVPVEANVESNDQQQNQTVPAETNEPNDSSLSNSSASDSVVMVDSINESGPNGQVQVQPGAFHVEGPHLPSSGEEPLSQPIVEASSTEELAVAAEVAPDEEEIEAQVQARVEQERGEIAAQAQRSLLDHAVHADVLTEEELRDIKALRLRRLLLLLVLLISIVAIVVPVTIRTVERDTGVEQDEGQATCALCADGSIPDNVDARYFTLDGDGITCTTFMEKQNEIDASSDSCAQGQALGWRYCSCPTLPPFPENSTCSLNFDGSFPIKDPARLVFENQTCNDWNTFVAHSESSNTCSALADEFRILALFCASDSVLFDFLNILLLSTSWETFLKKGSPQNDALYWLAVTDKAHLNMAASLTELHDRYAAAVFYFATGGPLWYCSYGFLSNSSVCSWNSNANKECFTGISGKNMGLFCSDGVVENITIEYNNLAGTLPDELALLTGLRNISVSDPMITGTIPQIFGNLSALEHLYLSYNSLTGKIPFFLVNIPTLKGLWLDGNLFTGSLPSTIGSSLALESFSCNECSLSGTIPTSIIDALPHLKELDLRSNAITGTLQTFSKSSELEALDLSKNLLTGTLPSMNALSKLTQLDLTFNNFTGPLPNFSENTALIWMDLSNNQFTGPLPTSLGGLTRLKTLDVRSNSLSSTILPTIGNLVAIYGIDLSDNQLTGSLPPSLGRLSLMGVFDIHNNSLTGTIPQSLENLVNLGEINFSNNVLIAGPIPSWLGNLTNLNYLLMRNTGVTGTIPTELGRLNRLHFLALGENELSGTVPTELGNFLDLDTLWLDGCGLGGSFPSSVANLSTLYSLYINGNNFTNDYNSTFCEREIMSPYDPGGNFEVLKADCLDETVVCPCCTHCCDDRGVNCECILNCDDDYKDDGYY